MIQSASKLQLFFSLEIVITRLGVYNRQVYSTLDEPSLAFLTNYFYSYLYNLYNRYYLVIQD